MERNLGWGTFGRTEKGAREDYKELLKRIAEKEKREHDSPVRPVISRPNTANEIYVPTLDLYFSKERTYLGKNWHDCHKGLLREGLRMATIPEFIELLKHLKDSGEDDNLYKEITEVRNPWRSEWLDADFKYLNKKGEKVKSDDPSGILYVNYNHILDSNGSLVPKNSERLETCLTNNGYADILNSNKQGLPTKTSSSKEFYFWAPLKDNNSVARFNANSGWAYLVCDGDSASSYAYLGVRAVRQG
jgi:hypothetical protein